MDVWAEEELKTGTLSNGTVENYLGTIRNIKKHPLAERKLKNVTSEHLQSFFDLLSFGGVHPDGKERKGCLLYTSPVNPFSKIRGKSLLGIPIPLSLIDSTILSFVFVAPKCKIGCSASVSYTHLDVYKRQEQASSSSSGEEKPYC